jgi:hypothetical protein
MIDRDTTLSGRRLELGQKINQDAVPGFELACVERDLRRSRRAAQPAKYFGGRAGAAG